LEPALLGDIDPAEEYGPANREIETISQKGIIKYSIHKSHVISRSGMIFFRIDPALLAQVLLWGLNA